MTHGYDYDVYDDDPVACIYCASYECYGECRESFTNLYNSPASKVGASDILGLQEGKA